jgi:hypothetical protein
MNGLIDVFSGDVTDGRISMLRLESEQLFEIRSPGK